MVQERRERRRGEEMLMDSAGQLGSWGLHSVVVLVLVVLVFYHETSARYDELNYSGWLFYWMRAYSL